ncbi:Pimeloyl-ACP methyl ester carboxylesterase [Rhizobiales bacterium GAS191]|nr:Pimeloyl-ACP methyl ester carboxylesterase [Rhizobiales bacterium GAS191]
MAMNTVTDPSPAARTPLPELELVRLAGPTAGLRGLSVSIRQAGPREATPIICMHGIGSNSSGYRAQFALADRYRMIAWDAPGYGRSDPLPDPEPSPDRYADALAGLADALGHERLVLVGSSFGAVIAASFAVRHKERALGLVLAAPAAGNAMLQAAERARILEARIGDMERLGPAGVAVQRAPALVAPNSPRHVLDTAARLVSETRPQGYAQAAHALDQADTIALAPLIAAPTLVIVGALDIVTPVVSCAEPIHAKLRHGRMEILDGIGHLVKLEAPERFNRLVADFVAGLG